MAASDATFAIPAARLGLGYGYAGVKRLAEVVGPAVAMEMFFTARRLGAEEALRIGLINHLLPVTGLEEAVAETAARICENAPMTIAAVKAAVRELAKPSAERDLAAVERMVEACFASDDFTEGRRAFMEKRAPHFAGR
jgi:enoyl-CoA hydratase/carnithine racemase